MTEWVISDIALGIILYLSYLVIAMASGSSRKKVQYSSRKVSA
jgi:hypothetical protein